MPAPNLQTVLLTLQSYWERQGCLIWQPYYTQVGAGTMNPATFLRVLGPEPWRVAYVEPSVRPTDGRYGENPNRLGQYYQYQVILKPDPGDPQELYLRSLEALGISLRDNDVRFVEDNWEQPALGAWGLGWEVWLNGQEITQFTYFQQAGGVEVEMPSVEITYGIERILMALQRVGHFKDIRWLGDLTYGDVFLQSEIEHSRYNFLVADVGRLRQLYENFRGEAHAALEAGLVLPAHDYLLKCSHAFNVLDARGAVGVTERATFFAQMRDLAGQVARAYLAQRKEARHPLEGKFTRGRPPAPQPAAETGSTPMPPAEGEAPFLLEIGVEELPAADLDRALDQLKENFEKGVLERHHLRHGPVSTVGTPRRIVLRVEALARATDPSQEVVWGPAESAAFDAQGKPTPALLGWAKKNGLDEKSLSREGIRDRAGKRYYAMEKRQPGQAVQPLLSRELAEVIAALRFDKSMRWDGEGTAFARPIRWLLALLGGQVIPFTYAGVLAAGHTRALRSESPAEFEVRDPADYEAKLTAQGILLDPLARRGRIREQVARLAGEVGGEVREDPALLAEVANLVEAPTAVRGAFEASHLALPREVVVSVMKKHQRYFPVEREGRLLPYFITVRNGDGRGLDQVREGNEQVLGARFADAAFFIREDHRQKLEAFRARLSTLAFQARLGSMLDKNTRIEDLTRELAVLLGLSADEAATARRAAFLCKADLASQMVVEMTSLQGVMGRYYALDSGEPAEVAQAIAEHYLPRGADDQLPVSLPGITVGLADRLDSLVGLFAAGQAPTGTRDPFGLRRAALGIVQVLMGREIALDLRQGLQAAAALQPVRVTEEVRAQILEFIVGRLRFVLGEQGYRHDVVEAVLEARGHNPHLARQAAGELSAWIARAEWPQVLAAYARCVRITREFTQTFALDPARLAHPSERALWESLQPTEDRVRAWRKGGELTLERFLSAFVPLIPAVSRFFEDVLVMTEERALRENRLGLLQRIAELPQGVVDFSKLEGF